MSPAEITAAQQLITVKHAPRSHGRYRAIARWWELEALRTGCDRAQCLGYALKQRWLAELAGIYGPGTLFELMDRQLRAERGER